MLVKAITSFAGDNFSYIPGAIAEVPDAIAQSWITHGLAVPAEPSAVDTPASPIVPAAPES